MYRRSRGRTPNCESLENRLLLTFDIVFDYTYDESGFFNPQERRDVLEHVASVYESRITDDLDAITPGGVNNWTAIFDNPATGAELRLSNLSIPADTIIVYVGARNLTTALAIGGPAGLSGVGSPAFIDSLQTRGEAGVDPDGNSDTDFSLWGGTITYDTDATWNFSLDPPSFGQNDLLSVTLHEMAHVLGFGTSESFTNLLSSNQFIGSQAVASFGGNVPMNADNAHFASGTSSTLPGTSTVQESAFDPQLTTGTRKLLTDLDWAAIDDIAWDITTVAGPTDYGDAPDSSAGTGAGNYQTRNLDGGPSHQIVSGLFIGSTVDGDDGSLQDSTAQADDSAGSDDEDLSGSGSLTVVEGVVPSIDVNVTNTTASSATLYGWIDYDSDGNFESGTESANVVVPAGTNNGTVTLSFPAPPVSTAGSTFARFRLSTDAAAASSIGAASDGEVEDHPVTIVSQASAFDSLPFFTWAPVSGAVRYELEVNNLTTGQNQVILQSELTEPGFRPHNALTPGNYNWRYRPHDGTSFLPWSPFVNLNISATTGDPFITDPVASSIDSLPTFAWSPVAGATRYELWVNGTSQDRVIHQTALTQTSFTPQFGLADGAYVSWVRAFNASGVLGDWSAPFTFSLAQGTTAELTDPVAGSTNTTPTFGWLPTGADGYTLRVNNLSTGTNNVVVEENLVGTSFTPQDGLPPGNYSATIQPDGGAVSATRTFQVLEVSGQAEITNPVGDSENPLPVFSWTSVAGATRYELWVTDLLNNVSPIVHNSSVFGTAYASPIPLPVGSYRAWVRAFNNFGPIGIWSSPSDYRVTEADKVPTVWNPSQTSDNGSPEFVWSNVSGATHYSASFAFGPNGGTGPLPIDQDNIKAAQLQLDTAFAEGDYIATITAWSDTTSLGSFARRFVVTPANTIAIHGPKASTINSRPTITWSAVSNATRYILWVNDKTRNINAHIYENNLASPVFTPNESLLPGDYRVWARAFNGSTAVSSWSSGVNFTIAETSAPPVITAPTPTTISSVPTISWSHVASATSYEIEVDSVPAGTVAISQTGLTTTSFRPSSALQPGLYRVRVRSVSGGTPSAWSSDFDLTIVATTSATLSTPLVGSSTAAADVFFAWSTVSTATRYELWVNNLTTGTIQVIYETSVTTNSFTPTAALTAGNYRAWVRGIAADNTPSAWSAGVDFTVAAHDSDTNESLLFVLTTLTKQDHQLSRGTKQSQPDDAQQVPPPVDNQANEPVAEPGFDATLPAELVDVVLADFQNQALHSGK